MDASSTAADLPPNESNGFKINIVSWFGFGVSTTFLAARLFTRFKIQRDPGWDDWILIFSAALNLVFSSLSTAAVAHGLGHHIQHVSPENRQQTFYYAAILQPVGIFAYCIPKLAVVVLLIKLMGTRRRGQWFLYGIITVLFVASALSAIFIFAQCDPPSHFWHPLQPAKCMSLLVLQRISLFAGSWSALTDLCLALFPITMFWNLQMPTRRKVSISVIMGLGVFAMTSAIIKTAYLPNVQNPDFTWAFYPLLVWTFVETNVVIICACIPILPRLVSFLRHGGDHGHDDSRAASSDLRASLRSSRLGTSTVRNTAEDDDDDDDYWRVSRLDSFGAGGSRYDSEAQLKPQHVVPEVSEKMN